ncbi:MAG: hypothetical protein ACR2PY_01105, partial [Salinispira sp.]
GITYRENSLIAFYTNGQVREGILAEDTTINGITYTNWKSVYGLQYSGITQSISFHENRQVRAGTLAEDTTINGTTYAGYSRIYFDEDGNVTSGTEA